MTKQKNRRSLIGTVVSDKTLKTRVVRVDRFKVHEKYKKGYRISKKYQAHDPKNEYHTGDRVMIAACRPISRHKRFMIIKKI